MHNTKQMHLLQLSNLKINSEDCSQGPRFVCCNGLHFLLPQEKSRHLEEKNDSQLVSRLLTKYVRQNKKTKNVAVYCSMSHLKQCRDMFGRLVYIAYDMLGRLLHITDEMFGRLLHTTDDMLG